MTYNVFSRTLNPTQSIKIIEDQDRKIQWVNFPGTDPMWALGQSALFIVCLASPLTSFFGSRPSDHYFRSVCLSVCAEFFSAIFDPISIKLGHMLYVSLIVSEL